MQLEVKKYLFDVRQACSRVVEFTAGKEFADYAQDPMLKAAVERQFEIVGEALNRLAKLDASVVEQISDHRRIIAFRNILVHAYAQIDDRVVWGVVETNLPTLIAEVDALLGSGAGDRGQRRLDSAISTRARRSSTGSCGHAMTAARAAVAPCAPWRASPPARGAGERRLRAPETSGRSARRLRQQAA
jgi:uncharacterized protein with HEPN domain